MSLRGGCARVGVMVVLGTLLATYVVLVSLSPAYPFNVPSGYGGGGGGPSRRSLAQRLLEVQREIDALAGSVGRVEARWSRELLALVAEMDPRVVVGADSSEALDKPSEAEAVVYQVPKEVRVAVCPEVYLGREVDPYYQTNFRAVPCNNAMAFRDVVTAIVSTKGWHVERIRFVVGRLLDHYHVTVHVITYGLTNHLDFPHVHVTAMYADAAESSAINRVAARVTTPYVFLAGSLTHFSSQSPLERLVRVMEDVMGVGVVAGAYRDLDGLWRHGCLQATMENYAVTYQRGYEHSTHECMYCDDVLGPMLVRTTLLTQIPFREGLDGPVMYRDWFLKVRLTGVLAVACPDVMFFVDREPVLGKSEWRALAKLWSVQYVKTFADEELEFSCDEVDIVCKNLMKTVATFLAPPCCLDQLRREMGIFQDCAEELELYYELQAGSLLGAVKMDGLLPWDFDSDFITDCQDQATWMSDGMACINANDCLASHVAGNYWTATCQLSIIDISCRHNTTSYLPVEYRHVPTTIEVDGRLTGVKANPGRVVRNRYGHEYLKHVAHWRYMSESGNDDGSGGVGAWKPCQEPAFHACLDHFPVDGNLKFKRRKRKH